MGEEGATLGQLLRGLEQQDQKKCDTDVGGCDAPSSVQRFLLLRDQRPPGVFTLQVAWESTREDPADIRDTLAAISEARPRPAGHSPRMQGHASGTSPHMEPGHGLPQTNVMVTLRNTAL